MMHEDFDRFFDEACNYFGVSKDDALKNSDVIGSIHQRDPWALWYALEDVRHDYARYLP